MQKLAALETNTGLPLTDRLGQAGELLDRLERSGLTELLTESGPGSSLVSSRIESFCRGLTTGLSIAASPIDGFIAAGAGITITVRPATGDRRVPCRSSSSGRPGASSHRPRSRKPDPTAGPPSRARLPSPSATGASGLTAATDLARSTHGVAGLVGDAAKAEARYFHLDDIDAILGAEVLVPGGPFTAGALPGTGGRPARKPRARQRHRLPHRHVSRHERPVRDVPRRHGRRELPRSTGRTPTTTRTTSPSIGVSWEDAGRFAAWLSERLGVTKRLPTEDEWEKAARGGLDVLYPWGDQGPAEGTRANFSGNGRFRSPSPVGSFESGENAWGLFDMAGNVWQWTSTPTG